MWMLFALMLLLAACGGPPGAPPEAVLEEVVPREEPLAAPLTVVATVYPLAWLAAEIAPGADVVLLSADGQDPHDLELSPGDRALLETADAVLYVGDIGFQPQVERAMHSARGEVVSLAEVAGPDRLREAGDDHDHAQDDELDVDPHLWFDPTVMADTAVRTGEALAAADPQGTEQHVAAAAAVADRLRELAADLAGLFSDCDRDTVVVSHEAYAYLLEPHEVHQEGVAGVAGHAEASPQRLAALAERVRAEGVEAVLAEPVEGRAAAEALAAEAGVELRDIESLEHEPADGADFPTALRRQAETFAAALGCS